MDHQQHMVDLEEVKGWLNTDNVEDIVWSIEKNPIQKYMKQIKEMLSTYEEFPEDRDRTREIQRLIKDGHGTQPIYVENGDSSNFVMEGRHRMVAFYLEGMNEIDVCLCHSR